MNNLRLSPVILAVSLAVGAAQADTRCVQEFLSRTAFDPGPVDGLWGRKTEGALKGFLDQVVGDPSYRAEKSATAEICRLMSGPRSEELLSAASLRDYYVTLDPDSYVAASTTAFDFSGVDVDTGYSGICRFQIVRILTLENNAFDWLSRGTVEIESGTLKFDKNSHEWRTGGLSDGTFLAKDANLKIDRNGMVHGRMPYFNYVVGPGEAARLPRYAELSYKHEPGEEYPDGTSYFLDTGSPSQIPFFRLDC